MAKCPTQVNNTTLEASKKVKISNNFAKNLVFTHIQDSDWGICHTDCPLRQYRNNSQLRAFMVELSSSFPNFATTFSLGKSVLGQELIGLRLTMGANQKRTLLKPMVKS